MCRPLDMSRILQVRSGIGIFIRLYYFLEKSSPADPENTPKTGFRAECDFSLILQRDNIRADGRKRCGNRKIPEAQPRSITGNQ